MSDPYRLARPSRRSPEPPPKGRTALAARILRYQRTSLEGRPSEQYDTLAMAVHRWQRAHAPVVSALTEDLPERWQELPAVPVELYKELAVGTAPQLGPAVVFRTSGTTRGVRGCHFLWDTTLYDAGSVAWARRRVPDAPGDIVSLLTDPEVAPDSSLSHMVALFPHSGGRSTWHLTDGIVDVDGLRERLQSASGPIYLCATAFALDKWMAGEVQVLPKGSVVMVTGGFKGHTTALSDDQLYAAISDRLAPERLVTEYGMTELSSQLWGTPGTAYRPPPWLRALAVDPETAAPLPAGREGQLRFYDLANLDSSLGVETLDRGVVTPEGHVWLRGRLKGSEARGCSLTVEEATLHAN